MLILSKNKRIFDQLKPEKDRLYKLENTIALDQVQMPLSFLLILVFLISKIHKSQRYYVLTNGTFQSYWARQSHHIALDLKQLFEGSLVVIVWAEKICHSWNFCTSKRYNKSLFQSLQLYTHQDLVTWLAILYFCNFFKVMVYYSWF